jgi:hypothetical protein
VHRAELGRIYICKYTRIYIGATCRIRAGTEGVGIGIEAARGAVRE